MSSETRGETVDLHALTESEAASGVEHGDELTAFAEAVVRGSSEELGAARASLEGAMGPAALVDAAAVVGNFQRMVRVADATGIPLDKPVAIFSADMREDLGIDAFGAAANTPPVSGPLRLIGRLAQPLLRPIMSRYASRRAGPT